MPTSIKIANDNKKLYAYIDDNISGLIENLENLILASGSNGYSKSEKLKNR